MPNVERSPSRFYDELGCDFLGVEAIEVLENKFGEVGVNVRFPLNELPPFPYTEGDLQAARTFGEMLVLRPEAVIVNGRVAPLTMREFTYLLRRIRVKLNFSERDTSDWYRKGEFAQIRLGWALVKKDVLPGSTNSTWNSQEYLLRKYEAALKERGAQNASVKRRTAAEAVYDLLLHYANTGEMLLQDKFDWTLTRGPQKTSVFVGDFNPRALVVSYCWPESPRRGNIGVCPSR